MISCHLMKGLSSGIEIPLLPVSYEPIELPTLEEFMRTSYDYLSPGMLGAAQPFQGGPPWI